MAIKSDSQSVHFGPPGKKPNNQLGYKPIATCDPEPILLGCASIGIFCIQFLIASNNGKKQYSTYFG